MAHEKEKADEVDGVREADSPRIVSVDGCDTHGGLAHKPMVKNVYDIGQVDSV